MAPLLDVPPEEELLPPVDPLLPLPPVLEGPGLGPPLVLPPLPLPLLLDAQPPSVVHRPLGCWRFIPHPATRSARTGETLRSVALRPPDAVRRCEQELNEII